jgi:hypothetical protein
VRNYGITAWFACVAIAGIAYATARGQVSTGYFDAALIVLAVMAFFRDRWRARALAAEDPGPDLLPPRQPERPRNVRLVRGEDGHRPRE